MSSLDGTIEMVAGFFVAVFRPVQPRFVHRVVGGFREGFQPHHVDARYDPRLIDGAFRGARAILALSALTPSVPPIAEGHSASPNLPLTAILERDRTENQYATAP